MPAFSPNPFDRRCTRVCSNGLKPRVQREAQRLADTHMSGRTTRGSAATSTARTSGPASALFVAVESAAALYTYQTIAAIQSKSTPTYGLRFKCVDSEVQSRTGDPLVAASAIPSTARSPWGWVMAMGGSSCIIYGCGDCTQAGRRVGACGCVHAQI